MVSPRDITRPAYFVTKRSVYVLMLSWELGVVGAKLKGVTDRLGKKDRLADSMTHRHRHFSSAVRVTLQIWQPTAAGTCHLPSAQATSAFSMFELFDPQADYAVDKGTNLPHWYQPGVTYFVTFRTKDSIPNEVRRRWYAARSQWLQHHKISNYEQQFPNLPIPLRREYHERFSREYMESLDKGFGACVLARPELNAIVAASLLHFDSSRYHLGDFVVMPNHVHALVCLLDDTEIVAQCTSWKRFSARMINRALSQKGRFWQEESFDHLVRSPEQFAAIRHYIAGNPRNLNVGEYFLYRFDRRDGADGTRSVPATL